MPATHFAMDVMNQSQNSDDKLEALTSQLFISSLAHSSLLQPPFTLNLKHILNSHNNLFLSTVHTHLSATQQLSPSQASSKSKQNKSLSIVKMESLQNLKRKLERIEELYQTERNKMAKLTKRRPKGARTGAKAKNLPQQEQAAHAGKQDEEMLEEEASQEEEVDDQDQPKNSKEDEKIATKDQVLLLSQQKS